MRSNSTAKKPASTTSRGTPISKGDRKLWAKATEQQIRSAVTLLLQQDYEEDKALALIGLLDLVAYENEFIDRDFMAYVVRTEAFTYTRAFDEAVHRFGDKAKRISLQQAA